VTKSQALFSKKYVRVKHKYGNENKNTTVQNLHRG